LVLSALRPLSDGESGFREQFLGTVWRGGSPGPGCLDSCVWPLSGDVVFKGRTLLEKFVLQLTVAGFVLCVAIACYGAFKSCWRGAR
jgi:hypothetical protein